MSTDDLRDDELVGTDELLDAVVEGNARLDRLEARIADQLHRAGHAPIPAAVQQAHLDRLRRELPQRARAPRRGLRSGVAGRWRRRLAGVAAGATGLVAASGGAVAYAQDALPGDPLYGLKRATEQAQLLFERSDAGDAELHARFGVRRLEEAAAVPEEADALVDDALESLTAAQQLGADTPAGQQAVETLERLLASGLPEDASDQARAALTRNCLRIAERHGIEADCGGGEAPEPPGRSGQAPGHTGEVPSGNDSAPGQGGEGAPGRSGQTPATAPPGEENAQPPAGPPAAPPTTGDAGQRPEGAGRPDDAGPPDA